MKRLVRVAVSVLAALTVGAVERTDEAVAQGPFSRVTIGPSTYLTADALSVAALLPASNALKVVLRVVRQCRGVQAHAFLSLDQLDAGVVAWAPGNLRECLEVSGGGPTRRTRSPCLQAYRTPADQDPANLTNRVTRRYYVMLAATDTQICADISTQVPGGVWGRTTIDAPGLPAGSLMLIKCQTETSQGLLDYIAEYRDRIPADKAAFWFYDAFVFTGISSRLLGVPSCSGVSLF